MASEFRKVGTNLPRNKRFRKSTPFGKLVYYYLLSNRFSNSAGCYEILPADISYELDLEAAVTDRAIQDLSKVRLISYDYENEVVLIERHLKHNPITNKKHSTGTTDKLLDLPDCSLRSLRIQEILDETPPEKLEEGLAERLKLALKNSVPPDRPNIGVSPPDQTRPIPFTRPDGDNTPPKGGEDLPTGGRDLVIGNQDEETLQKAFDAYNDTAKAVGLPMAQVFSRKRKSSLRQRLKDCGGLDGWSTALEKVAASPFLRGEKTDFRADLDFILSQNKFNKIMEGSYDGTGSKKSSRDTFRNAIADV